MTHKGKEALKGLIFLLVGAATLIYNIDAAYINQFSLLVLSSFLFSIGIFVLPDTSLVSGAIGKKILQNKILSWTLILSGASFFCLAGYFLYLTDYIHSTTYMINTLGLGLIIVGIDKLSP